MSQSFFWPSAPSGAGANASVGPTGSTAPGSATEVGFVNSTGQLTAVSPTTPLPENIMSIANNAVASGSGASNLGTLRVILATDSPVSAGAATSANQLTEIGSLASIDSKTPLLGQAVAASSSPVVLTAAQLSTLTPLTSVTVTQAVGTSLHAVIDSGSISVSNFPASTVVTQPVGTNLHVVIDSGSITANAGTNLNTSLLALESGGNLASINTKVPALGQALSAASVPVVLPAAQLAALTPLSTVTVTQAVGTSLHAVIDSGSISVGNFPASTVVTQPVGTNLHTVVDSGIVALSAGAALIGSVKITDGTNTVAVGAAGNILVSGAAATGSPPALNPITVSGVDAAGNKQYLKQVTGTNALVVDGSAVTQPVSISGTITTTGTVTANAGTNLNTSLLALESGGNLASINAKVPALGQALAAASVPVVLTAAQLTTLTPLASVVVTQATGTNLHVVVDATVLPTGASTSANQTTEIAALNSVTANQLSGFQKTLIVDNTTVPFGPAMVLNSVNYLPVTLPSTSTPASAVPLRGVSITGKDAAGNAQIIATNTLGQIINAPISPVGRAVATLVRNDYSVTPVTTTVYVQLVASTVGLINLVELFDSSGQTLVFAVGAAGSEVNQFFINPGGNGIVSLAVPLGSRISIKAVTASATAGYININMYS